MKRLGKIPMHQSTVFLNPNKFKLFGYYPTPKMGPSSEKKVRMVSILVPFETQPLTLFDIAYRTLFHKCGTAR